MRAEKRTGKNTCSNAPGSVYASKLFLATGDSSYLQAGIRLYEWTKENLQDPADGLYFDNKSLNGEIGRAKFAYNSGQMMQSAALLYRITSEKNICRMPNGWLPPVTIGFLATIRSRVVNIKY